MSFINLFKYVVLGGGAEAHASRSAERLASVSFGGEEVRNFLPKIASCNASHD